MRGGVFTGAVSLPKAVSDLHSAADLYPLSNLHATGKTYGDGQADFEPVATHGHFGGAIPAVVSDRDVCLSDEGDFVPGAFILGGYMKTKLAVDLVCSILCGLFWAIMTGVIVALIDPTAALAWAEVSGIIVFVIVFCWLALIQGAYKYP